jgi:hypothetical protein
MSTRSMIQKLGSALDKYKDITLPLGEETTRDLLRNVCKLTRLYQVPKNELGSGVAKSTHFKKLKVRKLLLDILDRCGPTVVFLCSQAAVETQFGRLNSEAVLQELDLWHKEVTLSTSLEEVAKYLLDKSRSEGTPSQQHTPVEIQHGTFMCRSSHLTLPGLTLTEESQLRGRKRLMKDLA